MDDNFGVVYKVINKINGKVYIGQTSKSLEERKKQHIYSAKNNYDNYSVFHKALRKYGENNFEWRILEYCDSKEELDEMEFHYIKQYDSFGQNGYNLTLGGEGVLGIIVSDENKRKMSIRNSGFGNPIYGKSISDICGGKISEKLKEYYSNNPGTFTGRKHWRNTGRVSTRRCRYGA